MNIKQAKEQIKNAMTAYFSKDDLGNYAIPIEKQRPVLLIGPPGIGKTAIMEQIAAELGVGLVSYSMTHHTRQSALGLPFITRQEFEGYEYQMSEYTMSEIIGSIYALMRETSVREGILFLDEINCVSETLAPCMLQFLQYKVFGQHQIPKGWIVVTAGNPPEYNKSVRDFDIVTWDRLKRIDVEADYETWKEYASAKGVHPAVLTYLAARKKDFYKVESTVDGKHFVTARGWDDLSEMIRLYEANGIPVDELLIGQYIQTPKIAKDFAIYYDLFRKYRSDYQIDRILAGTAGEDVLFRAQRAPMDERMSFLGLLFDAVTAKLRSTCEKEDTLNLLTPVLREVKTEMTGQGGSTDTAQPAANPAEILEEHVRRQTETLEKGRRASSLSMNQVRAMQRQISVLEGMRADLLRQGIHDGAEGFALVQQSYRELVEELKASAAEGSEVLKAAFDFCERAFEEEEKTTSQLSSSAQGRVTSQLSSSAQGRATDEILVFVTELTVTYYTARFIGHYGCDKYYLHNKELQFAQRQMEIEQQVNALDLDL
ncbi:MAG: AAA family ATPase [Firmicutes bacterium]|nr:AAA family ATPase [Bacillota bacterium]